MNEKILVVDDEQDVVDLVEFHLSKEGFSVDTAADGATALEYARKNQPALVVLDLMLPGMTGLEVCRALKGDSHTAQIPVVMLTAKAEEIDRIIGFELGADDYVVKPFSPREFILRVRAVIRRGRLGEEPQDVLTAGDLVVNRSSHTVIAGGRSVDCTATEFRLLALLIERQGRVQSRDRLLSDVWGYEASIDTRTVDTHMRRLREKLGGSGGIIETVRGFGYRITAAGA